MSGVLIFSGTTEGRTLAEHLTSLKIEVHVRVATEYGAEVMDDTNGMDVKIGSCGGANGIASVISDNGIEIVVDATHPYATRISAHVKEACDTTGVEYIRIIRDKSTGHQDVIEVGDISEAVDYLKDTKGNILITTGAKDASEYTKIPDYQNRITIRVLSTPESVKRCIDLGFKERNVIAAKGPFSEDANFRTLRDVDASFMVTKDSGTSGGFEEKIRAAERAGVNVIVIRRPEEHGVPYDEAVRIIEKKMISTK